MERRILHLQVPAFSVSVLRVFNPHLRHRPVAILRRHAARAVVSTVSSEARREGVRPGMCLSEAHAHCPDLRVMPADRELEKRGCRALLALAAACTPLVEPVADGRLFADLTGTSRLLGAARDTAARIQKEAIHHLGLPCIVGLSSNKLVSDVACWVTPVKELSDVHPGDEESFLSPLPATYLPAARPPSRRRLLSDLNLNRVHELAALPLPRLVLAFKGEGYALFRQSRGQDASPVRPPSQQPHVRAEETLAQESLDDGLLRAVLFLLVERVGGALRRTNQQATQACLALRSADGQHRQRRLRLASTDAGDSALYRRLQPALEKLTARRQRIRWLELTLSGLQHVSPQMELFARPGSPDDQPLSRALDLIRQRYGETAVRRRGPTPVFRESPGD